MEGALDLFAMAAALHDVDSAASAERRPRVEDTEEWESWLCDTGNGGLQVLDASCDDTERRASELVGSDKPFLVEGCEAAWDCTAWTWEEWEARFGEEEFALHSGQTFPLREYLAYCRGRAENDSSPLYLFEDLSETKAAEVKAAILRAYRVPSYFANDLFELPAAVQPASPAPLAGRPRFRWILVGPARSGTKLHIDPVSTSAWNTLLRGHKRWVLLPPNVEPSILRAAKCEDTGEAPPVSEWFASVLPRIAGSKGLVQLTQRPGQTIHVPAGWWHIVINLDLTLAVTQNFAAAHKIGAVAEALRAQPPSPFKSAWFAQMRNAFPALALPWEWPLPRNYQAGAASCRSIVRRNLWLHGGAESDFVGAVESRYNGAVQRCLAGGDGETRGATIPRVIHHVWLGKGKIPKAAELLQTWSRTHSGTSSWAMRMWRDKDVEGLGLRCKKQYDAACNYGEKADIARYEILWRFGGVYVDIDFQCVRKLDELVEVLERSGHSFAAGMSNVGAVEVNNGLLLSSAGHPVLDSILKEIADGSPVRGAGRGPGTSPVGAGLESFLTLSSGFLSPQDVASVRAVQSQATQESPAMETISRTGPGLITRVLARSWERFPSALVLPQLVFYALPNDYRGEVKRPDEFPLGCFAVHYWLCSWLA